MEDERQKTHRIASAMIAEMNGENVITQFSVIGTLLTSLTGSFLEQHPDKREDFMEVMHTFFDNIREKCEQIADKTSKNSTDNAS